MDQYTGVPAFQSPGPNIDAKSIAAGKKIFSIPSTTTAAFMQATEDAFETYAKQAGASVTSWPNQGQTSQWVQGMQTAVSAKSDVISLIDGTDPRLIMPQVTAAKNAGIPVVDVHDLDMSQPTPPNVAAFVSGHFATAGQLLAAWAITQTKGDANVLVVTSNNFVNSPPVAEGIQSEFKADCPSCKVTTVNVDAPDWPTKIQSAVQTAITRDPKLNYVLPVFDSMLTYVVPGVRSAAAVGRVKAASFNGSPAILDLVRAGDVVTMDIGENPAYVGAAGLDQTLRVLGKLPPSPDEHLVLRVFDTNNVKEAGVPAMLGQGYGEAWKAGYLKTWGLQ
ncbi:sugar ABC transporter substrate-binding protein [Sphaerisporangium perillae]|uniref:sugar ABC transporter substrate-binding protein n=1 Tax=Sphaerisporangium perillae TaxID=2935860 RepID=UPI00200E9B6B|nr:substrate-binding domain-containing protein [Sphaerisporangium perillae]